MPRKKTTTKAKTMNTDVVRETFYNAKTLAEDRIGTTVAELIAAGKLNEDNAEFIASVIAQVVNDSINTVMATQEI